MTPDCSLTLKGEGEKRRRGTGVNLCHGQFPLLGERVRERAKKHPHTHLISPDAPSPRPSPSRERGKTVTERDYDAGLFPLPQGRGRKAASGNRGKPVPRTVPSPGREGEKRRRGTMVNLCHGLFPLLGERVRERAFTLP